MTKIALDLNEIWKNYYPQHPAYKKLMKKANPTPEEVARVVKKMEEDFVNELQGIPGTRICQNP